jgi:hypothetical protein
MGFLDNLESSLKSLESQDERDGSSAERRREERARSVAAGPWATQLKESSYVRELFDKAALRGHSLRTKIYMAWFDSTLRLEARGRVLQLVPTAGGILAEYSDASGQPVSEKVDLAGDPDELLERWLASVQSTVAKEESVHE